jgi:hypothetical protein
LHRNVQVLYYVHCNCKRKRTWKSLLADKIVQREDSTWWNDKDEYTEWKEVEAEAVGTCTVLELQDSGYVAMDNCTLWRDAQGNFYSNYDGDSRDDAYEV